MGSTTYPYSYDARGNIAAMPHLVSMAWTLANCLGTVGLGGGGTAYYQYTDNNRVRKAIVNGGTSEQRIYLGNYEIYRKYTGTTITLERRTWHISDDTGRIAMIEARTVGTDPSPALLTRYIYSNHLSTATLELDASGSIISYEEYHPYGTTSFQETNAAINAVAKRYRYTGKERDDESGFYYMSARYYAPWLGRWIAAEPLASVNFVSTHFTKEDQEKNKSLIDSEMLDGKYNYVKGNPIKFVDNDGLKNTIYLVNLNSGLSDKKINEIVNKSNESLDKILGKDNNIKVQSLSSSEKINTENLDKTDLIVVIGSGKETESYIKQLEPGFLYGRDIFGNMDLETTFGHFAGINTDTVNTEKAGLKSDVQTIGAWIVLHSLGHFAADSTGNSGDEDGHVNNNSALLRNSGQAIKSSLDANEFSSLDDILNNDKILLGSSKTNDSLVNRNEGWIETVRKLIPNDSGPAKDNYNTRQQGYSPENYEYLFSK